MKKNNIFKFSLIYLFVIVFTGIAWYCNGKSIIGIDDANIYFKYMSNLANGHGFVFNINSERVEGFTSILWTMLGAVVFYISSSPELILLMINTIVVSFALFRLVDYIDNYTKSEKIFSKESILLLFLLAIIPGYFEWTVLSLLETGLWACILTLLTLNILDDEKKLKSNFDLNFNILLILLVLCRPESTIWGAFFLIARFIQIYIRSNSNLKNTIKQILPSLIIFTGMFIGLTVWRISYFGYPFPNTFYAKVSSNIIQNLYDGTKYCGAFCFNNLIAAFLILFSFVYLYKIIKHKKTSQSVILILLGITFITLAIPLITGGDHFRYSRFIQSTLPLIYLCGILSLPTTFFANNGKKKIIVIYCALMLISAISPNNIYLNVVFAKSPIMHEFEIAKTGRAFSEKLNQIFADLDKYPSQGVLVAGGSSYFYKGATNDLLGLNNVMMAHAEKNKTVGVLKNHASFNKDVFFQQAPDLFFLLNEIVPTNKLDSNINIKPDDFHLKIFKNINEDIRFINTYSKVAILNNKVDFAIIVYANNNFLKSLSSEFTFLLLK